MRWNKRGLVVASPPPVSWARSHAMVPFVERLGDVLHLYFSGRDNEGRSLTGRAKFDPESGSAFDFERHPLLGPGALGAFDDSGAMGSCVVEHEGRRYLYYIGWSRGVTVPFYTFIGCAISDDGGQTFNRVSEAPVVERHPQDPFFTTSPWVLVEDGHWRMWYASCTGWQGGGGSPKHYYRIHHAESDDGLSWGSRRICIDHADENEYAIARPTVVRTEHGYRMWYSYRGDAYRIGYAESVEGLEWQRKDSEAGIDASANGWDSDMIEYPCVIEHGGTWYMLYNGNGYGATGIGLAVLESDD